MRRSARLLAAVAIPLLAACGSITDPLSPDAIRGARRPARQAKVPLLFVHGWNSSAGTWTTMIGRFRKDGWTSAEIASFSYNTSQSNATTAAIIGQKVDSILAATRATQVSIVTHSMGALSSRHYVRNLGGDGKVDALVSLGGPNHGTSTAYACLQTACREMYPGSSFLDALNATDETWGAPRYATWWSPCDEVINPRSSTPLVGATNTQTYCMSHSMLKEDAGVYGQVKAWVDRPATISARLLASRE
jgi:triacylglycerol lipase